MVKADGSRPRSPRFDTLYPQESETYFRISWMPWLMHPWHVWPWTDSKSHMVERKTSIQNKTKNSWSPKLLKFYRIDYNALQICFCLVNDTQMEGQREGWETCWSKFVRPNSIFQWPFTNVVMEIIGCKKMDTSQIGPNTNQSIIMS